jgi:Primase C terminal 2 (PriCT-2).
MKKDVFNPAEWGAAGMEKVKKEPSPAVGVSAQQSAILAVVEAVEASGIDITASYSDWLAIAFALVSELGEGGRELFHRLSRFYPRYDAAEADRQYSACVRDGSREITIATLYGIAKAHGIRWATGDVSHAPFSSRKRCEEIEENEEVRKTEASRIGTFSQSVGAQLPGILKRIVADAVSEVDADLLILGSLTVFSACIPNVYGVYDRREVFANLFLYVTASASSGKGRLSLCRHLAAPLHRELREQYRKSMEKYKQEQVQYVVNRKNGDMEEPKEPPFLTLFIPANSTATVVYQTLSQNDGVGLLFETEGDTLANAFNSDLGNYSDGFRKAFHHEAISYLRKKDREYVEIMKPKFSAILSGTPEQVFNLIPSAENGLLQPLHFLRDADGGGLA